MMRAVFVLFTCVLLNAWTPAAGADISAYQHGVLIQGRIEKGDYARLIAFIRHPDNYGRFARSVFLDSPGGDVVEAIRIANLLDKSYAATHVASGARCYSACFILWMSGVTRHVSTSATLGVHRIQAKLGKTGMDPQSEPVVRMARRVEDYMLLLGTPQAILDKMKATAPTDLFVFGQRWLAEQQLLTTVSYRLGFIDAAQAHCGPEPLAVALRDKAPQTDEEEQRWVAQLKSWIGCADELRASSQRGDEVTISALIGGDLH
jgi:ATP-dependent protease ClpP protease subunit